MYQFAAGKQTNTAQLPAFFHRFQTKVRALQVHESKITSENVFNRDHFISEGNHEQSLFWLFLQKYVYLNTDVIYIYI